MKKAKRSEVPKEYRRDYKKEFKEFCGMFAVTFGFVAFLTIVIIYGLQ